MAVCRWDNAAKARKVPRDRGMSKKPNSNQIWVKNKVDAVVAEDRSHPQRGDAVYARMKGFSRKDGRLCA